MKYHLHENGWTIMADDFDFRSATQDDVNQMARLLATNTCVVIRNQHLSVEEELRAISMFKNPEPWCAPDEPDYINYVIPESNGLICRVTGELNEHGEPGIAGHVDEMTWHCNQPWNKDRRPLVWLRGVRGTKGSRTSWNNNILSYNDLDDVTKDKIKDLQFTSKKGMENWGGITTGIEVDDYTPNLVQTNIAGKKGLFLPFLQIERFKGMTKEESQKIIQPLAEHTIKEEYCYHHDWEDGDIVIAEQILGIHKRWRFEAIEKRLLHRSVFDFPDQDYI